MKFKTGDKVRFIGNYSNHSIYFGKKLQDFVKENNNILYIEKVCANYVQVKGNTFWCFNDKELELVDYTYEDLKKSPIGTKLTFENGRTFVKAREDRNSVFTDIDGFRSSTDLKGLKDNWLGGHYGKIIKIEEPEYKTVYEAKVVILDDVEKRYLRGIVTPFRDKVKYITLGREVRDNGEDKSFISIGVDDDIDIMLPYFNTDTMYKNMKIGKEYTLEELGL